MTSGCCGETGRSHVRTAQGGITPRPPVQGGSLDSNEMQLPGAGIDDGQHEGGTGSWGGPDVLSGGVLGGLHASPTPGRHVSDEQPPPDAQRDSAHKDPVGRSQYGDQTHEVTKLTSAMACSFAVITGVSARWL